jgi:hypothetical protein
MNLLLGVDVLVVPQRSARSGACNNVWVALGNARLKNIRRCAPADILVKACAVSAKARSG